VVITTHTDIANGTASPLPYNVIHLYPHPPLIESFPAYRSWPGHLLAHEYAHILHLDQARGFPGFLRHLFGRIILPNAVEPLWLIEGIATHVETEFEGKGRGNHPFSRMILHTALRESAFPPVDRGSGIPGSWPRGKYPYIYGSGFYRYLSETYGPDTPYLLERSHSRMILPFWLGLNSKRILDKTYPRLWDEWREHLAAGTDATSISVPEPDPLPSERITHTGEFTYGARFSPSGETIAFSHADGKSYPAIFLADSRFLRAPESLAPRNSGSTLTWGRDGASLIFAQQEINFRSEISSDLYRRDLATGRLERLTLNRHLRYPDYSPARNAIAATRSRPNRSDLVLIDPAGGREEILLAGDPALPLIFEPRFSPDGEYLAFSATDAAGNLDLHLLHLDSRRRTRITRHPGDDISPAWSPDGQFLLFASNRDGRYNLYSYSRVDSSLRRITDTSAGAFSPEVSPDGFRIIYSGYRSSGFDLYIIPFAPERWVPVSTAETVVDLPSPPAGPAPAETAAPVPYSPLSTLLPRFWIPYLTWSQADDDIETRLGLITGSRDALGRHLYILNPFYHTGGERPGAWAFYENRSFYPRISLSASQDYLSRTWGTEDAPDTSWIESRTASVGLTLPFPSFRKTYGISLGFRGEWETPLDDLPEESGLHPVTFIGPQVTGFLDSSRAFPLSPGTVEGFTLLFSSHHYLAALGSTQNLDRYRAEGSLFLRLPGNGGAALRGGAGYHPTASFDLFPRGYPESLFSGAERAGLLRLTLKSPPCIIERGIRTLPVYLNLVYLSVFGDSGLSESPADGSLLFRNGMGISLVLRTTLGYVIPVSWDVTAARGLDPDGETQLYVTMNYQLGSGLHEHRRSQEILSRR